MAPPYLSSLRRRGIAKRSVLTLSRARMIAHHARGGTLYQLSIEKFPDMENMQFPDIDRRDWPTLYRIAYYYAELLWNQDKWRECGPAFDHARPY